MSAGPHLSRRLRLEGPARAPDGAGGFVEVWEHLGIIWAEVAPRTGRDDATISRLGLRITVRAAPQGAPSRPTPQQRFVDGTRIYRIEAVTETDPEGRYLTCYASEEAGA
ncbi:head-tail adaptor protein [Rhodophyticola sp. CCM32]|uniref:head-tail adaptor protein n=1 Tax=Rhodophyticola sp. CCM32 TaxID=2916397 RepID=UPI00107F3F74|nr:head-tail adaptor protein [Rhodophyticola sp. CCM32]QBX99842.1 head-tail adaptor protein [Rhodophyticola sp. CCM32]